MKRAQTAFVFLGAHERHIQAFFAGDERRMGGSSETIDHGDCYVRLTPSDYPAAEGEDRIVLMGRY